ncbi:MAG: HD domain-containing phosphohydrolase [Candidatus Krumholzibacteriia bacterium]
MPTATAWLLQPLTRPLVEVGVFDVHQALLLVLGLGLAHVFRQARLRTGLRAQRRVELAGLAQAVLSGARLAGVATGVVGAAVLPIAPALAELAIVAVLVDAGRRLGRAGALPRRAWGAWVATAAAAVAFAALSGASVRFGFAAGWPAAVAHAGLFGVALLSGTGLLARERQESLRTLDDRAAALAAELTTIQAQRDEARRAAEEGARLLEGQRAQVKQLGRRALTLERILQLSARINATRSLNAVLQQVAEAVRESLGFRMVLLRIWSPSTQVFEARAFAGITEEGKAHLIGLQIAMDQYRRMTQPRFRVSSSYFISHKDEEWAAASAGGFTMDLGERGADEWHEDDMLIVPLLSADGEVLGYLSVDDPVDRRLPALEVIHQLEVFGSHASTAIESAELYDQLARNNLELSRVSEQLKNLNELKSNFVANVSHELRTPLTSIRAYTETLVHNQLAMDDSVRNEFLTVIHQECEKLTAIMDDILDLSRIEDGTKRGRRQECSLIEVVRRQVELAAEPIAAKGIGLQLDLPADDVRLSVDAAQMGQVIEHLLNNAVKFTPAGGTVRVALYDGLTAVKLMVEDTGIGIPDGQLELIFDRFYQVDGSSTREHGGQGVGLTICRDIVQWHEGRIWAEKRQPSGARLQVVLPRAGEVVFRGRPHGSLPAYTDPQDFGEKLVHWIGETMGVRNVSLMIPEESGEHLLVEAAVGLSESVVQGCRLRRGEGVAGKVWASGRSLLVSDIVEDGRFGKRASDPQYATASLLSVPLFDGLDCVGVVNVNNRLDGRAFTADDLALLEAMAPRIGHLLLRRGAWLEHTREFAALRDAMRTAVAVRRERHDALTDVCHEICLAAARRLKLPQEELENLAFALKTYDLGLARLSEPLLRKAAPLTNHERELIRQHVHLGLEILAPLEPSSKVRQIILHHHERFDGLGYPDGLEGEAIPIGSRLVALTDGLNAMLQGRAYRSPLTLDAAMTEIGALAGSQFCPRLVEPFTAEARLRGCRLERFQGLRGGTPVAAATPDAAPVSSGRV